MSMGSRSDFADDPDSIFVELPPNPRWVLPVDLLVTPLAALGGVLGARYAGASTTVTIIVATTVVLLVAFKVSFFVQRRRAPTFSVDEFESVRRAGTGALAAFRSAHPDLTEVGWSMVARTGEGRLIAVCGSVRQRPRETELSCAYLVPFGETVAREVRAVESSHSRGIERITRAECRR